MECGLCKKGRLVLRPTLRDVKLNGEEFKVPHDHYECTVCANKIITEEQVNQYNKNAIAEYYRQTYSKYRGKCRELSEKLVKENPKLKLIRGFYYCPMTDIEEMHWWCEDENGFIIDPTEKQFRSEGHGTYRKFNGVYKCSNCKEDVLEVSTKKVVSGRHVYCNDNCYKDFMGCD